MPLMKDILAADFKKDFDLLGKLAKKHKVSPFRNLPAKPKTRVDF